MAIIDLLLLKKPLEQNLFLEFKSHFVHLKTKTLTTEVNCQEAEFTNIQILIILKKNLIMNFLFSVFSIFNLGISI